MKKIIGLTIGIGIILAINFVVLEPTYISSAATTDAVTVSLSVTSEITISQPSDLTLPSIPGMSGGSASGEVEWTVKTNNNAGYTLTLAADAAPALDGSAQGDTFADYTPAVAASPDYAWAVADNAAEFGFSVYTATSADLATRFTTNVGVCNPATAGSQAPESCWYNTATSAVTVVSRTSETDSAGQKTTVLFKAQLYNSDGVPNTDAGMLVEDTYATVITVTATES